MEGIPGSPRQPQALPEATQGSLGRGQLSLMAGNPIEAGGFPWPGNALPLGQGPQKEPHECPSTQAVWWAEWWPPKRHAHILIPTTCDRTLFG